MAKGPISKNVLEVTEVTGRAPNQEKLKGDTRGPPVL